MSKSVKTRIFSKNAKKTAFLADTNLDELSSEQAGTPNSKSINIFNMFSLVRKVQNEL